MFLLYYNNLLEKTEEYISDANLACNKTTYISTIIEMYWLEMLWQRVEFFTSYKANLRALAFTQTDRQIIDSSDRNSTPAGSQMPHLSGSRCFSPLNLSLPVLLCLWMKLQQEHLTPVLPWLHHAPCGWEVWQTCCCILLASLLDPKWWIKCPLSSQLAWDWHICFPMYSIMKTIFKGI